MELSQNARVVVVDNEPDDVKDLMNVLAEAGIATIYCDGLSGYPAHPLCGVRFLFLDLELDGVSGSEAKNKASAAAGNYARIVSPDNGPIIVILWTEHDDDDVRKLVEAALRTIAKNPLFMVWMSKSECKDDSKKFSPALIKRFLVERLDSASIVGLYVTWENAVFNGTVKLAARLSSVAKMDGSGWPEVMSRALYKLYKANCDKNVLNNCQQQFLSACRLYNDGLLVELNQSLANNVRSSRNVYRLKENELSPAVENSLNTKLNAFLYYDIVTNDRIESGDVVVNREECDEDRELKKTLLCEFGGMDYPSSLDESTDVRLCKIILTPPCDMAQNKRMMAKDNCKYDRYVWALLVKGEARSRLTKDKDRFYKYLKDFEYNGDVWDLLVDLYAMGTMVLDENKVDRLFTLKPIPLADIQSKAANQLNRIGICAVE